MTLGEDGAVIPLAFVEGCLASPPAFAEHGEVQAFCDFAAGGDENVMAVRRGNRVGIVAAWREKDTMHAVGRFIRLFQEHGLHAWQISADEGGLGVVMCDALHEAGWPVRRVNNGSPASRAVRASPASRTRRTLTPRFAHCICPGPFTTPPKPAPPPPWWSRWPGFP